VTIYILYTFIPNQERLRKMQLAISQSSSGLGLVACLDGQKINIMPNTASRKFSYIPKVICAA
jgi:hypothetical protein